MQSTRHRQIGCGFYTPNIQLRRGRSPVTGYGFAGPAAAAAVYCLPVECGREKGAGFVGGGGVTVDT